MDKLKNLSLVILSGLLFTASWPCIGGFSFLLFFAFVPLLFLEDSYYHNPSMQGKNNGGLTRVTFFGYAYLCFFIWNLLSTWWIYYSTSFGAVGAIVLNSFFMTSVFYLFHLTRKKIGNNQGYVSLVVYWIAWEWFHMEWDLSWPWLTLGNGFANYYTWIQWYEYTGVFGGSLWVLIINILLFKLVRSFTDSQKKPQETTKQAFTSGLIYRASLPLLLLLCPIVFSLWIYFHYDEKENPVKVVVVQPNSDPYNEKFDEPFQQQLKKMFDITSGKVDSSADYLVFPETALTENIWENEIDSYYSSFFIKDFLKNFPHLKIVTGASTYYAYSPDEGISETARPFKMQEGYYDAFNTGLQFDSTGKIQIYHKSKLVVGVEKMPFPALFKPLESFAIDLGGTSGSLGVQAERSCLVSQSTSVAPVICYESIYGEYVTGYVKNGADLIFIITNDGWWENSPGHRQHLAYGRLRAIETRRSIARSANTGISCFINQKGDIQQQTKWWEPVVITQTINRNSEITFYTKSGDYIARSAIFCTIILLCWTMVNHIKNKNSALK